MVITPQKENIMMGDIMGSCEEPYIKMTDMSDSIVGLNQEISGKDPRNPSYDAHLVNAKKKVKTAVGTQ